MGPFGPASPGGQHEYNPDRPEISLAQAFKRDAQPLLLLRCRRGLRAVLPQSLLLLPVQRQVVLHPLGFRVVHDGLAGDGL
ncbi:MAG: hypothetical protein A3J53_03145 [Candidatus Harrisonbacteria bacterium RIFCSPHIGHO2_02_FULL_40_20]|nr:MAG: hypothetical protein A3J53_03145 [Candidatus Harrisonbacteria bacterium RIFCSPHIGHO2_02_FULL_40_20]